MIPTVESITADIDAFFAGTRSLDDAKEGLEEIIDSAETLLQSLEDA